MFADPLLDLVGEIRIINQEVTGVLFTLSELITLVGVPSARLLYNANLYAEIDKRSLT